MDRFDMTGTIDMHVHTGPDLFPRVGDDLEIARDCAAGGMAGMAVKCHFQGTEVRASLVNQVIDGFTMYGGVTLNYGVGGMNPLAVESSLAVGGRVVWGPSGHAKHHAEVTGTLGGWGKKTMRLSVPAGALGITALDENGDLTDAAHEVVRLVREHDALLATSHLGPADVLKLVDEASTTGARVLVNHVLYIPKTDMSFIEEVIRRGAAIEICSVLVGGFWNKIPIEEVVHVIQAYGFENIVLSSDAGGINTSMPRESLRVFADHLIYLGIPEEHVRYMMTQTPQRLLGIA
jgi:hypothetical protein